MKATGPYVYSSGSCKGRRFMSITKDDGTHTTMLYSRWLMQQHLGRELGPLEHVDHKDEDKTNDSLSNLQILTPAENSRKSALGRPSPAKGIEKGFTHGTTYGWMKKKCECQECQGAKAEWGSRRNATRRTNGSRGPYEKDPLHGTTKKYYRGCRCDECRAANAAKKRREVAAKAAQ